MLVLSLKTLKIPFKKKLIIFHFEMTLKKANNILLIFFNININKNNP